ncbi:MAG TPA: hypothetical protein VH835_01700 [Dongiaceae bacterium]|jgi:hypothetical protein
MGLFRRIKLGFGDLLARGPAIRFAGGSEHDWLPPSMGPSDWSHGMLESLADRGAAWYFDRR